MLHSTQPEVNLYLIDFILVYHLALLNWDLQICKPAYSYNNTAAPQYMLTPFNNPGHIIFHNVGFYPNMFNGLASSCRFGNVYNKEAAYNLIRLLTRTIRDFEGRTDQFRLSRKCSLCTNEPDVTNIKDRVACLRSLLEHVQHQWSAEKIRQLQARHWNFDLTKNELGDSLIRRRNLLENTNKLACKTDGQLSLAEQGKPRGNTHQLPFSVLKVGAFLCISAALFVQALGRFL